MLIKLLITQSSSKDRMKKKTAKRENGLGKNILRKSILKKKTGVKSSKKSIHFSTLNATTQKKQQIRRS